MNESKARMSLDRQPISANRRRFSEEFKRDAVRLVVDEEYTFKAAAKTVGVGP
jgi:transposase-like protein